MHISLSLSSEKYNNKKEKRQIKNLDQYPHEMSRWRTNLPLSLPRTIYIFPAPADRTWRISVSRFTPQFAGIMRPATPGDKPFVCNSIICDGYCMGLWADQSGSHRSLSRRLSMFPTVCSTQILRIAGTPESIAGRLPREPWRKSLESRFPR